MNVVCPRCGEIIDAKREEMMGRYIACRECCYVFFWYTNLKEQKTINIEDILRVVGITRIIFENNISIQVPPNLISGFEKEFIEMGIDDFGGISPFTLDFIKN